MIRLDNVRKVYRTRFGDNVVLDGISFDLHMGQRLGCWAVTARASRRWSA